MSIASETGNLVLLETGGLQLRYRCLVEVSRSLLVRLFQIASVHSIPELSSLLIGQLVRGNVGCSAISRSLQIRSPQIETVVRCSEHQIDGKPIGDSARGFQSGFDFGHVVVAIE